LCFFILKIPIPASLSATSSLRSNPVFKKKWLVRRVAKTKETTLPHTHSLFTGYPQHDKKESLQKMYLIYNILTVLFGTATRKRSNIMPKPILGQSTSQAKSAALGSRYGPEPLGSVETNSFSASA
jgi:hypothetical protein